MDMPNFNDDGPGKRKLKSLLESLKQDDVCQDYADTPIYQMGFHDGQERGMLLAERNFKEELKALNVFINSLIDNK